MTTYQEEQTEETKTETINLPWYVPGVPMDINKLQNIRENFSLWDWEDIRDFLCLIGLMTDKNQLLNTNTKIDDYKVIMSSIARSMWKIQTYAHNKTYDAIAMECRIIVEAVCSFILEKKVQDVGQSIKLISKNLPNFGRLLFKIRKIGCTVVHLDDSLDRNNYVFKINENTAYYLIIMIYDVLCLVKNNISLKYSVDSDKAIENLYKNRIKLSKDRLTRKTIAINKKKSCADESKPERCCKIGCPYLHRSDEDFSQEDSRKNLEIFQNLKNNNKNFNNTNLNECFNCNISG